MPPRKPKFNWQIKASRTVDQADGRVRLECDVLRNGTHVGTLVLLGASETAKASDLQPWWFPNGEGS
jgi:hypothetical protein